MNDITFEIVKIVAMVCAVLITRYLIPLFRNAIGDDKIAEATKWIKSAVYFAQQTMSAQTGEERKAFVMQYAKDIRDELKIPITDEQIDILIESFVKELRIEEAKGNVKMLGA